MVNLIIWAILIIPYAILPFKGIPEPTRLIKEALFDFTMMGIIVLAIKDGLRFEYKNKYLSWLAIWGFIQIGFNWYYPLIRGYGYNAGTIIESVHFLLAVVATILFCSSVTKVGFIQIAKAIVFSATTIAIFGICQAIGFDPMANIAVYVDKEHRHIAATLDHPNLFANYIVLAMPFCYYLKQARYTICLCLLIIALLFAQSSLSIIAAVVSAMVFAVLKYRNKICFYIVSGVSVGFIALCLAVPSLNKFNTGFTGRIGAWKEFIHRDVNPLFGNGFGVAKSYMVKFGDNYWVNPHNDYLMLWLCTGFLGLFLFGLLVINCFRNFRYNQDNTLGFAYLASVVAFLILMFGSFPMESAPLALIGLCGFWAMEKSVSWKNN